MKAEREGRRETTDIGSRQSVPQEDDGKKFKLDRIKPPILYRPRNVSLHANDDVLDNLRLTH
jgi:hypothetical protein